MIEGLKNLLRTFLGLDDIDDNLAAIRDGVADLQNSFERQRQLRPGERLTNIEADMRSIHAAIEAQNAALLKQILK